MDLCVICTELCTKDYIQVGAKRRTSLVAASLKREDGLHETLKMQNPLKLHIECGKVYTRESSIRSTRRKLKEPSLPQEEVQPPTLSSKTPKFDISTHCLFCFEVLPTSSRLATKLNKMTSNVRRKTFKKNILDRAKVRNDEWGEMVAKMIKAFSNLVAAEAKYHRRCAQDFFSKSPEQNSVGKPIDALKQSAFNELCAFLDENDECPYAVSDLMKMMEAFLHGEKSYSIEYFKQKLKERYKDDIIITGSSGKSSIVSFRDSAHRILREKCMADREADKAEENERILEMAASIIRDDIRLSVFDLREYPSSEDTENELSLIPGSLNLFLHKLLNRKGKNTGVLSSRCTAIAHSVVSACSLGMEAGGHPNSS